MDEITLTSEEKESLQKFEEVIEKNIQSFYEVGYALMQIREHRFYREGFETFEEYCKGRWEFSSRHAERLMLSSKTVEIIRPIGRIPSNEAQARPLAKLPTPELQQEAWKEAVETAPEGKVTARHVSRIVSKTLGEEVKKKMKKRRKKINKDELISDEFQKAFDDFVGAMHNARAKGWKTTSKEAVLEHLEAVKSILLIGG